MTKIINWKPRSSKRSVIDDRPKNGQITEERWSEDEEYEQRGTVRSGKTKENLKILR